jgi:hypothetical protein
MLVVEDINKHKRHKEFELDPLPEEAKLMSTPLTDGMDPTQWRVTLLAMTVQPNTVAGASGEPHDPNWAMFLSSRSMVSHATTYSPTLSSWRSQNLPPVVPNGSTKFSELSITFHKPFRAWVG